ncbi:MAG TPA: flippase [Anaerolineales bacterium]|jgi:O-antigen/teichoic acid export membrane protein|nr:flippase [Anaerolineales bacterium]
MNVLWLVLSRISSQALAAVLVIFVARRLGQSGLGQYAFITAVVFLGNTVSTFGLDTLVIRAIGRGRRMDGALLGAALWLQLALSLAFVIAIKLSASLLPGKTPETLLSLQIYSLSLIPLAFYTLFSAVLRAFERMDLFLVLNLISGLIQAGGGIVLLLAGARLFSFMVYLLVSQFLVALIAAIISATRLPHFSVQWKVSLNLVTRLIQRSWPLASLTVLGILYQRMGILVVSMISTDALTGWFAAAARIVEALKIVHYSFLGALFPVLAQSSYHDRYQTLEVEKSRFLRIFQTDSLRLLLGLSLVLAVGVTLLARPLVQLLFGDNFGASIPTVKILAWSLIPYAYSAKKSLELVTQGDERMVLKVTLLSAVLSGFLFMILTPTLNLVGASLAALAGESLQAAAYLLLTRNRSSRRAASPGPAFFFSSRRSTHNRIDPVP